MDLTTTKDFAESPPTALDGVFEAAIAIAAKEQALMEALRLALKGQDDQQALRLARQLVGLDQVRGSSPKHGNDVAVERIGAGVSA